VEVPDEGHAPRLSDVATADRITAFVASCDGGGPIDGGVYS